MLNMGYDNQALVVGLNDLLVGKVIVERKRNRGEVEKRPRVGVDATGLTSLSWLPYLNVASGIHRVIPEFILDRYPAWVDDGFISDNFGTLYDSLSPFPAHQQLGLRGLILTPRDAPVNRWHFGSVHADEVLDGYDVIDRMSKESGIVTLGQLSNLHSQPYRFEHPWTEGFCLVVGDSFEDRISSWNAGLLFDDVQNQTFKTMRIPAAIKSDEIRTGQIANYLCQRNWIGETNGPKRIVVRSYSLGVEDVREFVERLRNITMSYLDYSAIESLDDCTPPDSKRIYRTYYMGISPSATIETAIRDAATLVKVPKPMQLDYCAGMHPIYSTGSWFVDLTIDRLKDNSRFDNVREKWRLPTHPQLASQFYDGMNVRLSGHGEITVLIDIKTRVIEVKQPEDENIFYGIINDSPHYPYPDMRVTSVNAVAYKYSALSDKGRYLKGMLGIFGTLSKVEHFFNNHFWRSQFVSMATPAQTQHAEVIKYLQRRMKAKKGTLLIDDDTGWQNLAERVIQISNRLRVPRQKTRYDKLFGAWQVELNAAIEVDENLKSSRDEILAGAQDDLKRSLSFLLECGVFFRGHEWSCRHCSHRNWVGVELLKDIMQCEVCRLNHQLPIDVALDFRLNEFFATCLREHDTVAVA
jgi:hypothetical protein